ncbi:tRNA dihydrouridine synthase DusB [Candidatus Uhrbacteria bacterium RIFCSPHIGHO2_12_FULL_60_25]|uniref:tRNA-dihydrouridine synthase n=1 Tax=Candidatus Uhrbacteria bacterium RIFCSPHIGHO2_12_FULL_60_25 TaxID=1802399 RepID=A0A1F7UIL9_9BACT|nr:MAG: tRNA dihydrouridine synthase DusB [Candidatus Uhrbacteria bacterium RIFCSPHIGHO2_02_FULL_60_44]OGL78109.1 MAG: tRNA dihydrouridine synthase DusB [Candidatus Uhrbacteria bacterium RIFCSPHIGHO2_12_FULL_60_25]
MIDWKSLPRPIIALAPMADMTDLPFCLVCKSRGAPLVFREMVSSEAVVRMNPKTLEMAKFDERERPLVQQIFGADPSVMAEAARIIEETFNPDGIDINMGCPVYNIVSNFNGASLMREPERATAIVNAVKDAVTVPVSVKTRLGWSKDTDVLEFVKVLEAAGADLISIHGRTKEQGYSGTSNWDRVGEARRNTSLPVLVNGDITSVETAKDALSRSGADGVLIGRGALGNPWVFRDLVAGLRDNVPAQPPTLDERIAVVREHARLHVLRYGERGLVKLRKHLPWYFKKELRKQYPWIDFNALRGKLVRVTTLEELDDILEGQHERNFSRL